MKKRFDPHSDMTAWRHRFSRMPGEDFPWRMAETKRQILRKLRASLPTRTETATATLWTPTIGFLK